MLIGKRAVITGSTSGIGLAIARELASHGVNVVITGLGNAKEIEKTRVNIELEFAVSAQYIRADLFSAQTTRSFIEQAVEALGGIDILVNNAGIQHTDLVENFPVEQWEAIIALNLSAVFHSTAVALPYMKKQGWGRVINIAAAYGLIGSVPNAASMAAKHGVVGLTKVTALENAGSGVTANAICPGWVLTDSVERQIAELAKQNKSSIEAAAKELLTGRQPSLQLVTPKQLGATAVFLASEAADQMTGSILSMDGGWSAC